MITLLAACLAASHSFAETSKPNIVFLMTDDQRWDMLGCYGRKDVITPYIDKLAEEGVVFDNAYYAVAICMPSRATMFTGRYFSDHRSGFTYPFNRTLPKEEFAESYPAKLKEVGYRTGFVGKFGIRLEDSNATAAEFFDFFVVGNKVVVPEDDAELKKIYRKDRPANERTLKKGDAMLRFLETQPKDQPFCLSISFDAVKNDRNSDMYPPDVDALEGMEWKFLRIGSKGRIRICQRCSIIVVGPIFTKRELPPPSNIKRPLVVLRCRATRSTIRWGVLSPN